MKKALFCILIISLNFLSAKIPEKVLICGVCKDVEKRLPGTMEIMEHIGGLFDDYRILVYENNSSDKTPELLNRWAGKNPKVAFQSEQLLPQAFNQIIVNHDSKGNLFRPELIARARNIVLERALCDEYEDFDYLIWVDMDFVLPPDYQGIAEAFETDREWDAVLAYGIDPNNFFWDWYAFRDEVYPIGSELLGNHWWYMEKNFALAKGDDWYPVTSAFGGCGIYKKSSIEGCRYSALVTRDLQQVSQSIINDGIFSKHPQIAHYLEGLKSIKETILLGEPRAGLPEIKDPGIGFVFSRDPEAVVWRMSTFYYQYPSVCEHVPFHASMIVRGHDKIFINPRMIFRYGG